MIKGKKIQFSQLVILAGGRGSRLKELTSNKPKPLVKIKNNKTFLDALIENFSRYPINEILILCGYKYKRIYEKFHNKKINNITIKCTTEQRPLGTAGALKNSSSLLKDYFFLCNGDTYFDINIFDLALAYKTNKVGVIACSKKNKGSRYLSVKNKYVNGGVYFFNKKNLLKRIKTKVSSLENDIFPKLLKEKKIILKKYYSDFLDIGIKKDYKKANNYILLKKKKKTVLLDRDGVINYDYGHVGSLNRFKFKPNVAKAIKLLNDNNFYVFVVSNQSGVGRNYYTKKSVNRINKYISKVLKRYGAHIDSFYSAFYFADSKNREYRKGKEFRKPGIGMFKLISNKWSIDKRKTFMVGDQDSDQQFASNLNIKYFNIKKSQNLLSVTKKIIS